MKPPLPKDGAPDIDGKTRQGYQNDHKRRNAPYLNSFTRIQSRKAHTARKSDGRYLSGKFESLRQRIPSEADCGLWVVDRGFWLAPSGRESA
jgi:hypothetical protein